MVSSKISKGYSIGGFRRIPRNFKNADIEKNIGSYFERREARDSWYRDVISIVNSLAFRRLQYKTQIFLMPTKDHFSDRMRHTLSVDLISSRIARNIEKMAHISINYDLIRAIALAHDIGHTPFGHAGERALDKLIYDYSSKKYNEKLHFNHVVQSARTLLYIDYDSRFSSKRADERKSEEYGIGPSIELIVGVLNHSRTYIDKKKNNDKIDRWKDLETIIEFNIGSLSNHLFNEAVIVQIADKISNCVHDTADAFQLNLINRDDLANVYEPFFKKDVLNFAEKIENYLINQIDIDPTGGIYLSDEAKTVIDKHKALMKERVYRSQDVLISDNRAYHILKDLFDYYLRDEENVGDRLHWNIEENVRIYDLSWTRVITNYLAAMTDRFVENLHQKLFH